MRNPEGISAGRVKGFTSENLARLNIRPTGYSVLVKQGLLQCNTGIGKFSA